MNKLPTAQIKVLSNCLLSIVFFYYHPSIKTKDTFTPYSHFLAMVCHTSIGIFQGKSCIMLIAPSYFTRVLNFHYSTNIVNHSVISIVDLYHFQRLIAQIRMFMLNQHQRSTSDLSLMVKRGSS